MLDAVGVHAFSNSYIRRKVTCEVLAELSLLFTRNTCHVITYFYNFVYDIFGGVFTVQLITCLIEE